MDMLHCPDADFCHCFSGSNPGTFRMLWITRTWYVIPIRVRNKCHKMGMLMGMDRYAVVDFKQIRACQLKTSPWISHKPSSISFIIAQFNVNVLLMPCVSSCSPTTPGSFLTLLSSCVLSSCWWSLTSWPSLLTSASLSHATPFCVKFAMATQWSVVIYALSC